MEGYLKFILPPFPWSPGLDVGGVITKLGPEVNPSKWKVGDEVFVKLSLPGGLQEYILVKESELVAKAKSIPFEEDVGLGVAGITSLQTIRDYFHLKQGQSIFINGGTTATGLFGIQIAKILGASSISVSCSAKNFDIVKQLGATEVFDYKTTNFNEALKGKNFDCYYDTIGNHLQYASIGLKRNGIFVTLYYDSNRSAASWISSFLWKKSWSVFGGPSYYYFSVKVKI